MSDRKSLFLRFLNDGSLRSPSGDFYSIPFIARLIGVAPQTLYYWAAKACPELAPKAGKLTKAELDRKKQLLADMIERGEHVFPEGRLRPSYLLADEIGISPTSLMKWLRQSHPEVASQLAEGHCNLHPNTDPELVQEIRDRQRAAVSTTNKYRRRTTSRRVNRLRSDLGLTVIVGAGRDDAR